MILSVPLNRDTFVQMRFLMHYNEIFGLNDVINMNAVMISIKNKQVCYAKKYQVRVGKLFTKLRKKY